jgi:hypothetical protein
MQFLRADGFRIFIITLIGGHKNKKPISNEMGFLFFWPSTSVMM